MSNSDAQYRAKKKYNAKTYERIEILVYKGEKEKIKEYAKKIGKSTNKYINDLIKDDMNKNNDKRKI
jgi:hypothetical protein